MKKMNAFLTIAALCCFASLEPDGARAGGDQATPVRSVAAPAQVSTKDARVMEQARLNDQASNAAIPAQ